MNTLSKKLLGIFMVSAMLMAFTPLVSLAANYGFVPNSGEASVSKVDLETGAAVARYWTAPRLNDMVNLVGEPSLLPNTLDPYNWRTSRLGLDAEGNAWVLNVGSDFIVNGELPVQGSVVRIQADTTGLSQTNNDHSIPLPFGEDEAVQVFPVGIVGEMPRAVSVDAEGYIWIGFYGTGVFRKYEYVSGSLTMVDEYFAGIPLDNSTAPYDAKIDKNGILWFSSRTNANPTRPSAEAGVYFFDTASPSTTLTKTSFTAGLNPYSLLIDNGDEIDDVVVWATAYNNNLYKINSSGVLLQTIQITSISSEFRGMEFDTEGKIWIAGSLSNRVYSYNPVNGNILFVQIPAGITRPVGLGLDAAGMMWVVCRNDGKPAGFLFKFDPLDPSNTAKYLTVNVGYRPYVYDNFIIEPKLYDICGFKLNGDTDEPLSDWEITLFKQGEDPEEWLQVGDPEITDELGGYCFTGLLAGTYKVTETLQEDWLQIDTNEHIVVLPDGATDLEAEEPLYYDFVNVPLYEICGAKKINWTPPEWMGIEPINDILPDWEITLFKQGENPEEWLQVGDSVITDELGGYCFTELLAGTYKVTETLKAGWMQSVPGPDTFAYVIDLPGEGNPSAPATIDQQDFVNEPEEYCYDETVWAAQTEPGESRFVPAPGNWATYVVYNIGAGQTVEYPLYAGQYHEAGKLIVGDDGYGNIYVKYAASIDDEIGFLPGYCGVWSGLTEYHLQIVDEIIDFNPYRSYNQRTGFYGGPIPGSFQYKMEFQEIMPGTDWIVIPVSFDDDEVFIAAHGVMWWCGYLCEALKEAEVECDWCLYE